MDATLLEIGEITKYGQFSIDPLKGDGTSVSEKLTAAADHQLFLSEVKLSLGLRKGPGDIRLGIHGDFLFLQLDHHI